MQIFDKTTALLLLVAILVGGCSKNSGNPAPLSRATKARQLSLTRVSVLSLSPGSGIHFSAVTITGNNFDTVAANNVVQFNGVNALVNSATATQLVVTVPATAQSGYITVTTNGVTATSPHSFSVLHLLKQSSVVPYISSTTGQVAEQLTKITADKFGNLYGIAIVNSSYYIVKITGGKVSELYAPPLTINPAANSITNQNLEGLACDAAGNVYTGVGIGVSTHTIMKITPSGVATAVSNSLFLEIFDLAIDAGGNVYVAYDFTGVAKVSPSGQVSAIAPGANIRAESMTIDNSGNLYVTDYNTYTVLKISPQGNVSPVAANTPVNFGGFYIPLACDNANNLFIIENGEVLITNTAGYTTIFNIPDYNSSNPFALLPFSVAFDSNGNLFTLALSAFTKYSVQ
jgi:hypothetical protein